jgi:glutathione gamma-glutamylcysteinyltransferase
MFLPSSSLWYSSYDLSRLPWITTLNRLKCSKQNHCIYQRLDDQHHRHRRMMLLNSSLVSFSSSSPRPLQRHQRLSTSLASGVHDASRHHLNCVIPDEIDTTSSAISSSSSSSSSLTSSRHCPSCTCQNGDVDHSNIHMVQPNKSHTVSSTQHPCGKEMDQTETIPPPLPEPKYSVRGRILPSTLIALHSQQGHQRLIDCFTNGMASSYIPLTEHGMNQADPAFCGITTLLILLNTFAVDPQVRWRGGWRYFGHEHVLLSRCCLSMERIQRIGVTLPEWIRLAQCQGLRVVTRQPPTLDDQYDLVTTIQAPHEEETMSSSIHKDVSVDVFRADLIRVLSRHEANHDTDNNYTSTTMHYHDLNRGLLVTSFSRSALGQTGEGHFSPVGAYHISSDSCLILDVARFKYPPYWVSVSTLYEAMRSHDSVTKQPRGWCIVYPPSLSVSYLGWHVHDEDRRDAASVPLVPAFDVHNDTSTKADLATLATCPVHSIKTEYCDNNQRKSNS